eukprot:TRINITY_DN15490_c0_g1_i5.p1 TRINITY_DN15490_c0_g1~~TRINITY_DN15490_c0_g1_i5.p1  ORF type:complete len:298 (+),score=61.32 TRINITY_DN15490_c0_g1_i5:189-1082(+)
MDEDKHSSFFDPSLRKLQLFQKEHEIPHQGEVNRARYMPQQYNVIATKTTTGEVHIFDYHKHSNKPELKLLGHDSEGYGLSWNPQRKGYLVSGSEDSKICMWNIEDATELNLTMEPVARYEAHAGPVHDVAWHRTYPHLFGSVGADRKTLLWDIREGKANPAQTVIGHTGEVLSIDFNPLNEFLMATGSADHSTGIWDLRNLQIKQCSLDKHKGEVLASMWSPNNETVLATAGQDRKVLVWDLARGPGKELRFVHEGHMSKINDAAWNGNEKMFIASTSDDNVLQIWQIANKLLSSA